MVAGCWFHERDPDTVDCPRLDNRPIRVVTVRACDIKICDRLADVVNVGGHALCSGHAYGSLVVKPHTMTGRAL